MRLFGCLPTVNQQAVQRPRCRMRTSRGRPDGPASDSGEELVLRAVSVRSQLRTAQSERLQAIARSVLPDHPEQPSGAAGTGERIERIPTPASRVREHHPQHIHSNMHSPVALAQHVRQAQRRVRIVDVQFLVAIGLVSRCHSRSDAPRGASQKNVTARRNTFGNTSAPNRPTEAWSPTTAPIRVYACRSTALMLQEHEGGVSPEREEGGPWHDGASERRRNGTAGGETGRDALRESRRVRRRRCRVRQVPRRAPHARRER